MSATRPSVAAPAARSGVALLDRILDGAFHRLNRQPWAVRRIGLAPPRRMPGAPLGWYVRLDGWAGAWGLKLAGLRTAAGGAPGGVFQVHYYPAPEEAQAYGFSAEEQLWRVDPGRFDRAGTPCPGTREALPETAFAVGTLEVLADPAGTAVLARAAAQDWLVETAADAAGPIRRIAAWDLTLELADRLIQMLAVTGRAAPLSVRVGHGAGVAEHCMADGGRRASIDPRLRRWIVEAVLPLPGPDGPARVQPETTAALVATAGVENAWRPALTAPPFRRQPFVNIAWWAAAAWQPFDESALAGDGAAEAEFQRPWHAHADTHAKAAGDRPGAPASADDDPFDGRYGPEGHA